MDDAIGEAVIAGLHPWRGESATIEKTFLATKIKAKDKSLKISFECFICRSRKVGVKSYDYSWTPFHGLLVFNIATGYDVLILRKVVVIDR